MKKKRPAPKNDITGIILANQWDDKGNVIGIALHTDQEDIYLVNLNKRIKDITNFIQRTVIVEGKIEERLDGKKIVHVETVKTLENDVQDLLEYPAKP